MSGWARMRGFWTAEAESEPVLELLERRYRGEHPLWTLLHLYDAERGRLVAASVFQVIKHSPVWIVPIITAHIIDLLSNPPGDIRRDLAWSIAMLMTVIAQNVPTAVVYVRLLSLVTRNIELYLRAALCRRLQHLSISFYHQTRTGALHTKVVRDVEAVQQLMSFAFESALSLSMMLAAALVTIALRLPWFLLVYTLALPLIVLVVRNLRGRMQARNAAFREEIESMSSRVVEMTMMIPITRALGEEEYAIQRVQSSLTQVRASGLGLDLVNGLFGAINWTTLQLFGAGMLGLAAWLGATGAVPVTVGDVVLITAYSSQITGAVLGVMNLVPQIMRGFESIRSIGEVLECPDLEYNEGKAVVTAVQGRVTFQAVDFAYPDSDEATVRGFSLDVQLGEMVALVGPSGAAKSTILNLAIGFLRPSGGQILLDGRDMEALDMRTYRRHIALVPQEVVLFDGTVFENITYGAQHADERRVLAALRDANALEFVQELPQGVHTRIGDRGARLSGGQKQRLAIARALIRNPQVLLLDEATSALDPLSERLIQEALARLMVGRTTFVVAHRLSTIRNADRIVVMNRGQIVEIGTHEQLLAARGEYFRMQAPQLAEVVPQGPETNGGSLPI
jgi:ATP-binding cassette subfamily B protein